VHSGTTVRAAGPYIFNVCTMRVFYFTFFYLPRTITLLEIRTVLSIRPCKISRRELLIRKGVNTFSFHSGLWKDKKRQKRTFVSTESHKETQISNDTFPDGLFI